MVYAGKDYFMYTKKFSSFMIAILTKSYIYIYTVGCLLSRIMIYHSMLAVSITLHYSLTRRLLLSIGQTKEAWLKLDNLLLKILMK